MLSPSIPTTERSECWPSNITDQSTTWVSTSAPPHASSGRQRIDPDDTTMKRCERFSGCRASRYHISSATQSMQTMHEYRCARTHNQGTINKHSHTRRHNVLNMKNPILTTQTPDQEGHSASAPPCTPRLVQKAVSMHII